MAKNDLKSNLYRFPYISYDSRTFLGFHFIYEKFEKFSGRFQGFPWKWGVFQRKRVCCTCMNTLLVDLLDLIIKEKRSEFITHYSSFNEFIPVPVPYSTEPVLGRTWSYSSVLERTLPYFNLLYRTWTYIKVCCCVRQYLSSLISLRSQYWKAVKTSLKTVYIFRIYARVGELIPIPFFHVKKLHLMSDIYKMTEVVKSLRWKYFLFQPLRVLLLCANLKQVVGQNTSQSIQKRFAKSSSYIFFHDLIFCSKSLQIRKYSSLTKKDPELLTRYHNLCFSLIIDLISVVNHVAPVRFAS